MNRSFDWIVDVIERDILDPDYAIKFENPWHSQGSDGTIEEFATEDEACTRQVEIGRETI